MVISNDEAHAEAILQLEELMDMDDADENDILILADAIERYEIDRWSEYD